MKKSKGFTLIELLGVIILLGLIIAIIIPKATASIEKARQNSAADSGLAYIKATRDYYNTNILDTDFALKSGKNYVSKFDSHIDVNGDRPLSGYITISDDKIVYAKLCVNYYEVIYQNSDVTVSGTCTGEEETYTIYADGTAVYFNPVSGEKCTAGEAVSTTGTKTGCMKWYTFNDGGEYADTINLILDHNTTAVVAWNSIDDNTGGPANVMSQLSTDTNSWTGVPTRTDSYSVSNGTATYTINYNMYKARLITAAEIATITGNSSFVEKTAPSTSWFYLDSNNQTQTATTTGASDYDWLFDYTVNCTEAGCNIAEASNSGYWTSTAVSNNPNCAWAITGRGGLYGNSIGNSVVRGVRPVITILKSNL